MPTKINTDNTPKTKEERYITERLTSALLNASRHPSGLELLDYNFDINLIRVIISDLHVLNALDIVVKSKQPQPHRSGLAGTNEALELTEYAFTVGAYGYKVSGEHGNTLDTEMQSFKTEDEALEYAKKIAKSNPGKKIHIYKQYKDVVHSEYVITEKK